MTRTGLAVTALWVTTFAAVVTGQSAPFACLLIAAAGAAVADAWDMRIPNLLAAATAVAAIGVWASFGFPLHAVTVALIVAAAVLAAYEWDLLGGGDVKFIPSLALAVASTGQTLSSALAHVTVLAVFLFGAAATWAAALGNRHAPVAAGAPLALAAATVL